MKKITAWVNALERLKKGNSNYVTGKLNNANQDSARRKALIDSQEPFAAVLTCSDSRVVPELIFDTGIGELFVVRVAGNVANPSSIASIEYAVSHLCVELIIVLGHQRCGAVTAALKDKDTRKNISHLFNYIQPAISASNSKKIDDVSLRHSKLTTNILINESSIISRAVNAGNTKIIPAFYSLESGIVHFFI